MADSKPVLKFDQVVRLTFASVREHFALMAVAAGLFAFLPNALFGLLPAAPSTNPVAAAMAPHGIPGESAIISLIGLLATVVIVNAILQKSKGKSLTIGEGLGAIKTHFFTAWVTGLVAGWGVIFGLILLVVPGIFLAVVWCVAVPAAMNERWKTVVDPLKRSFNLTKGARWKVLGLMAVYGVAFFLLSFIVGIIGLAVGQFVQNVILLPLVVAVNQVFAAAGIAAIYQELVRSKEGGGAGVAQVFE